MRRSKSKGKILTDFKDEKTKMFPVQGGNSRVAAKDEQQSWVQGAKSTGPKYGGREWLRQFGNLQGVLG